MMPLNSSEIQDIAEAAAKKAVVETFLTLGCDVSKPEGVLHLQRNLAWVDGLRRSSDTVKTKGFGAAIVFLVTAGLGWVFLNIRSPWH